MPASRAEIVKQIREMATFADANAKVEISGSRCTINSPYHEEKMGSIKEMWVYLQGWGDGFHVGRD